jgi:hypothetical protein
MTQVTLSSDNTLKPVLEPLDSFCLSNSVAGADLGLASSASSNALTGTSPT